MISIKKHKFYDHNAYTLTADGAGDNNNLKKQCVISQSGSHLIARFHLTIHVCCFWIFLQLYIISMTNLSQCATYILVQYSETNSNKDRNNQISSSFIFFFYSFFEFSVKHFFFFITIIITIIIGD